MKRSTLILILIFTVVFLLTRFLYLGRDEINPDAVNWHYRAERFIVSIKAGDWMQTYQHYHPGVTLMWLIGVPVEIYKQLSPENSVYNHENFLTFHSLAKASVMLAQLFLSVAAFLLLKKFIGEKKSFFTLMLFSLEPFFLGNSRLLHLDALAALLIFNGLLLNFWSVKDFKWWKVFLTGSIYALAFLTKSISIGALVFGLFFGSYWIYRETKKLNIVGFYVLALLVSFISTTVIIFPAMWVQPLFVFKEILREGERVGVREGHSQIFFGEQTTDAGFWFYPLVVLMKITPFTLFGVGLYKFFALKNLKKLSIFNSLEFFLFIFYFGYLLVMFFPTKKLDRYILPVYPFLALMAVQGYDKLTRYKYQIIGALFSAFILYPVISFYPYYFTYFSPVFMTAQKANDVLVQKPFGIGIPALKDFIFEKYGEYPKLGFYDIKPMRSIYMNSRICDVRACFDDAYDIMVLGPGEEFPKDARDEGFVHDSSFWINGLEYWKIYAKKAAQ